MKVSNLIYPLLVSGFIGTDIFARSLRATAEKLGQEATQIGYAIGVLGLVIGGSFLALGRQEGGKKVTDAIMGTLIILTSIAITTFLKSAI